MDNNEEKNTKENLRIEKLKAEEADSTNREKARTTAYQAKELEIEKQQKVKEDKRAKNRAEEEIKAAKAEKARKEIYLAQEKKRADELEARRNKDQ